MLRTWCLAGVLVALTGCEVTKEERTTEACTALCSCEEAPLPGLQERCIAKCEDGVGSLDISEQCLACITSNTDRCATIEQVCGQVCSTSMPVDDGGPVPL